MEKILPGKYVEISYELFEVAPEGTETAVHTVEPTEPERFIFGVTPGLLRPLELALEGLEAGRTFDVLVPSAEGFPYNPDDVAELDKDIFTVDGKFDAEAVKKGAYIPMQTADGFRITGKVLEVTDKIVKMDFNHPLVGKDLRFKGKVEVVRDATPEELHPTCGCGGCGGGGSDSSCGDGCEGGCCSK
jgi:FKBP-type peptidyl-prolyl cis-trans isomerase SlyD